MNFRAQQRPPPGYEHFPSHRRETLLLPHATCAFLMAKEAAYRAKEEEESFDPPKTFVRQESAEVFVADHKGADQAVLPFDGAPSIQVFKAEEIAQAIERLSKEDSERAQRHRPTLEHAAHSQGYRRLIDSDLQVTRARLNALKVTMPNFCQAIDILVGELALGLAGAREAFRVAPLALYGAPGIGKTRFAREVASLLDVPFESVAMGSTGGFELAGVSSGYSTSQPGRISRALAEGESGMPLVLLDEIDKMAGDERFPTLPVLLELLETDSAQAFRDEALGIRMDASRIIFIATANEADWIPAPLQSRLRLVEVIPPSAEQRYQILDHLIDELAPLGLRFPAWALEQLAQADLDLRALQRLIRETAGRTLADARYEVTEGDLMFPVQRSRKRAGFL